MVGGQRHLDAREAMARTVARMVELEEGPHVTTNIVGCDPAEVSVGMAVKPDFATQERSDGEAFAVPRFTPA